MGFAKMKLGTNITTSPIGSMIVKLSLKKIINVPCSHSAQHHMHLTACAVSLLRLCLPLKSCQQKSRASVAAGNVIRWRMESLYNKT